MRAASVVDLSNAIRTCLESQEIRQKAMALSQQLAKEGRIFGWAGSQIYQSSTHYKEDGAKEVVKQVNEFFTDFVDTGAFQKRFRYIMIYSIQIMSLRDLGQRFHEISVFESAPCNVIMLIYVNIICINMLCVLFWVGFSKLCQQKTRQVAISKKRSSHWKTPIAAVLVGWPVSAPSAGLGTKDPFDITWAAICDHVLQHGES